jgi:hypothetical protein
MGNKSKQTGATKLLLVLTVALIIGLLGLANKMQQAHIKSIKGVIEQQFQGRK